MKRTLFTIILTLFFVSTVCLPFSSAQDYTQDYTTWGLPEGVTARLGKGVIDEVAYSPDGTLLAVASGIGIWLYDTDTLQEHALLTGHTQRVNTVSFSPDGNTIASGSLDTTVRLWDVATATQTEILIGHTDGVNSVSFSPDGKILGSGSWDSTVHLWDVATATHKETLFGHTDGVSSVSFSPDGNTIATNSRDNKVRLWDVATATQTATLQHEGYFYSIAFSPDSTTLASGNGFDVRLWDVASATHKSTLTVFSGTGASVTFSPDGTTLASSGVNQVHLWDVATATQAATLQHSGLVRSVAFSPDGNTIASSSSNEVRFWDVATATHKNTLTGHTSGILSVAFSPDGNTIASAGNDNTVRLWDVATKAHIQTGHTGRTGSVAFSPDGNTITSGDWGFVRLWDVATGTQTLRLTGHTAWVSSVAFSPNGNTIASGSYDKTVRFWDVASGTQTATLEHTNDLNSVAFSPDGNTIATSSRDNTVRLWDVATATQIGTFQHTSEVNSVSFSPDGHTIAGGGLDDTVLLWDVATGTQKRTLNHISNVNSVVFSPDGKTIASGGDDRTVRLWDVATGTQKGIFQHLSMVRSVSFSPDGTTLASGSDDGTVLIWDLTLYLNIDQVSTDDPDPLDSITLIDPEETPGTIAPSRTGSEYLPDEWTLGLWHFDGENIVDSSTNGVQGVIEGNAQWNTNQDWHEEAKPGHSFSFDGNTLITLGHADVLIPTDAITVEAWVYPQDLSGWRLIGTNWDFPPGAYHLNVRSGYAQFHINTDQGVAFVFTEIPLELGQWSHLAGTYDSNLNQVKLYVNGVEVASREHSGKLADNDFDVVIGSKNNRAFKWNGLIDEVRISSIARQPEELSPNLANPTMPVTMTYLKEDVNRDGVVDLQDLMLVAADLTKIGEYATDVNEDGAVNIADLVLVAAAQSGNTTPAVPTLHHAKDYTLSRANVEMWLQEAKQLNLTDPKSLRGIYFLEQLLLAIAPEKTALLANYPNPFNPETWIPYQLAKPAAVSVSIYAADGKLIRKLTLGHQAAGVYHNRIRAAYWDGKNAAGESVASGVFFYTLTAGDFSATRKMLILK